MEDLPTLQSPIHKNWYKHKLEPVVETESSTIIWDLAIHTDRKIDANKPDITIKDHKNNFYLPVEQMFPVVKNKSSGELGKISKYKDLRIKIERMWHPKPMLIPGSSWYSKNRYNRIFTTNH